MKNKTAILKTKRVKIKVEINDFENDYISLADIARYKNHDEPKKLIKNWIKSKDVINF